MLEPPRGLRDRSVAAVSAAVPIVAGGQHEQQRQPRKAYKPLVPDEGAIQRIHADPGRIVRASGELERA